MNKIGDILEVLRNSAAPDPTLTPLLQSFQGEGPNANPQTLEEDAEVDWL